MLLTADADAVETQTLECMANIYSLMQEIESQRDSTSHNPNFTKTLEISEILEKDDKGSIKASYYQVQKLKNLWNAMAAAVTDEQQSLEIRRKAYDKIKVVCAMQNDRRIQARETANEETYILLIEQDLCNSALTDIQQAEEIKRNAEDKLNEANEEAIRLIRHEPHDALIKMLQSTAQTLPIYVGKVPGPKPPSLCGAIPAEPAYIAKMGDMVAAFVKAQWLKGSEEGPEEDNLNWILAKVVHFNPTTNEYEVVEVDMEEMNDRHTLSRSRVVPLPLMRVNPETDPDALFPKGSTVMAMFAQFTCFFKAVVHRPPTTATEEYLVLLEDPTPEYSSPMSVAQRYVISIKESKKTESQCNSKK